MLFGECAFTYVNLSEVVSNNFNYTKSLFVSCRMPRSIHIITLSHSLSLWLSPTVAQYVFSTYLILGMCLSVLMQRHYYTYSGWTGLANGIWNSIHAYNPPPRNIQFHSYTNYNPIIWCIASCMPLLLCIIVLIKLNYENLISQIAFYSDVFLKNVRLAQSSFRCET